MSIANQKIEAQKDIENAKNIKINLEKMISKIDKDITN